MFTRLQRCPSGISGVFHGAFPERSMGFQGYSRVFYWGLGASGAFQELSRVVKGCQERSNGFEGEFQEVPGVFQGFHSLPGAFHGVSGTLLCVSVGFRGFKEHSKGFQGLLGLLQKDSGGSNVYQRISGGFRNNPKVFKKF